MRHTSVSLFLTGRAGTGKTTFLKNLRDNSQRKMVVAAPTGIAAINAGGVTLHSLFQLPFGTYLPDVWPLPDGSFYNRDMLFKNVRLSADKRRLLNELDVLVIDEVSMLRCDVLDAIDVILRGVRKNPRPFGNVQVLFIGDLQQLPPVVQDGEWNHLSKVYENPFFFSAKAYQQLNPLYIELKHIYRQKEATFINLLEKVRTSKLSQADVDLLNSRYITNATADRGVITLTTHNSKADKINHTHLEELTGKRMVFEGALKGDFNERNLPVDKQLALKIGAQVMFVKNDSSAEKRYFNGKMGVITALSEKGITVQCVGDEETIEVSRETWTNIKYVHNQEDDAIAEEETGSYAQFPLKLAWAITIHKSQGLTFDKIRIDAAEAFAGGQVYVALSRCRTLEGIQLTSRIGEQAIITDSRLNSPWLQEMDANRLNDQLQKSKREFARWQLSQAFRFNKEVELIGGYIKYLAEKKFADKETAQAVVKVIYERTQNLENTGEKFVRQLEAYFTENPDDGEWLKDRSGKAIAYFANLIHNEVIKPVEALYTLLKPKKGVKQVVAKLETLVERCWTKLNQIQRIKYGDFDFSTYYNPINRNTEPAAKKAGKTVKGETYAETLRLFEEGKTVAEIAEIRGMAASTIEGHLAKWVADGQLALDEIISVENIAMITKAFEKFPEFSITQLREVLGQEFSYTQIRMVKDSLITPVQTELP